VASIPFQSFSRWPVKISKARNCRGFSVSTRALEKVARQTPISAHLAALRNGQARDLVGAVGVEPAPRTCSAL